MLQKKHEFDVVGDPQKMEESPDRPVQQLMLY